MKCKALLPKAAYEYAEVFEQLIFMSVSILRNTSTCTNFTKLVLVLLV